MKKHQGTIYLNNGRYWWKIRLPGQKKQSYIALKTLGAKYATKDYKTAVLIANELWQEHLRKQTPDNWDSKLATLVQMYNAHNESYYLPPSREAKQISHAIFALAEYFPKILADDFSPLHLKEFQRFLVNGEKYDWCRKLINERIRNITRMFKWAASETLISIHTYTALTTVEGLRKGRTTARESKIVRPADMKMVDAVIEHVTPVIADMIRVQLYTGMRSGELIRIRPCNIDRSGEIWLYEPQRVDKNQYSHKTEYLGYSKVVALGPKAQQVLRKYLLRDPKEFCFKPEESYRQWLKRKADNRVTPLHLGNKPGTNNKGTQKFNELYTASSYLHAIKRACKAIWPAPKGLNKDQKKQWEKENSWHPHQLRHNAATNINKKFGVDAARTILGHRSINITDQYIELDLEKAKKVAQMVG